MLSKTFKVLRLSLCGYSLCQFLWVPVFAQKSVTDPPDSVSQLRGSSLSQIESVNPITGNLGYSIPLGHLPPGPAGFSAGVNLVYNSSISDIISPRPSTTGTFFYPYAPSAHGGGWNYSYKFTLWAQPRFPGTMNTADCAALSPISKRTWFKNFLMTPDGNNHVLTLIGVINSSGVQTGIPTDIISDANDAYVSVDFAGNYNQGCLTRPANYQGTLVFVTSDSTYIRIEATTPNGSTQGTWTAYFPDGTRVSGNSAFMAGQATNPSDMNNLTDRNANKLTVVSGCGIGTACTATLQDDQGRNVTVNYSSFAAGGWVDTVTSPGPNGIITSTVNWATTTPSAGATYYNAVDVNGNTVTSSTQNLALQPGGFTPSVVTSVQLPAATSGGNQTIFTFGYGASATNYSYGEMHSAAMCVATGTTCTQSQWSVAYNYLFDPPTAYQSRPPATPINPIANKVLSYSESRDGVVSPISETTSYLSSVATNAFTYPTVGGSIRAAQVTYPDGSYTVIFTTNLCPVAFKSRDYCPAMPYKMVNSDGTITEMGYAWNAPPLTGFPAQAVFNPYLQYSVSSPADVTGPSGGVTIVQDQNGNIKQTQEYDWIPYTGVPRNADGIVNGMACPAGVSPCNPTRTTTTSYYNPTSSYYTHGSAAFLRAKNNVTVGSSSTTYTYDNAATTANVTQVQQYDTDKSSNITWSATYLSNGNISTQTDANGFVTVTCYTSNLYPLSKVIGAKANSTCGSVLKWPEARTNTYSFDAVNGMLSSETDSDNSITTTYNTYDNLGRAKTVTQSSAGLNRVSTTTYDDLNRKVTSTQDDVSGQSLTTTTYGDPLGRVTLVVDGTGNKIQKAYRYGTLGMTYELESNPYSALTNCAVTATDCSVGWTLTTRNSATRTTTIDHYATATPPAPWGNNTVKTGSSSVVAGQLVSGCLAPSRKVTDEVGNVRAYWSDGLGRLLAVAEPDATITNYGYDLLNNLSYLYAQSTSPATSCPTPTGAPLRSFNYSSLSRLISATNPESGTSTYDYDNNGNIRARIDANATVTSVAVNPTTGKQYDALNRPYGKTYTSGSGVATNLPVSFVYDQDFRGALSSTNMGSGSSLISTAYTHDSLGRIATSTQTTPGWGPFLFTYGYSLTDQLTDITYPTGRKVKYNLDLADRVNTVQNVTGGGNYATITYTAPGGVNLITMGNGVTQQVSWNDRLQPTALQVKNASQASLLALGFYPCTGSAITACSSGNNGTLRSQSITSPGLSLTQSYSYDSLNRLTGATENNNPLETYNYVGNGNRYVVLPRESTLRPLTLETPTAASWYGSSNRILSWTYDAAGNVKQVGGMNRTFVYDANNLQVTSSTSGSTATYVYDGNGMRVSKSGLGQTTTYVYDAFGNLAVEYSTAATSTSPCGTSTCYVTSDHLGSTRMLTNNTGSAVRRYDYLPFGQEILSGTNGRSTGYLSAPDGTLVKFTGQGRDQETADPTTLAGLDWFNARYMSSVQGRFQSADPANAGASPADPQTWNGYAYVNNNPLTFTDPTGEGIFAWIGGIVGGFFGGPGGAFWGAQIGNGIDAAVFGPDSTKFAGAPDITGGLLGSGGPLSPGSINSGQWSEQSPLGGGGSLQGGIGRGLIIQNYAEPSTEFFAGAGDSLTWNATWWARKGMGTNDIIDFNSSAYRRGAYLGSGVQLTLSVGGAMKAAAKGAMQVAVGRGALPTSPVHVAYNVGGPWMHANGRVLGKFNYEFWERGAAFARKAGTFSLPIRYPAAVTGLAACNAQASSCITGAFSAFLKGWGW